MPELPEVETVRHTLEVQLKHPRITDVQVFWDNIIAQDKDEFINTCIGKQFSEYRRIGKYLMFKLEDKMLIVHLRMEGKFYILTKDDPLDKHTHVIFKLDDGRELRYHDTRKFGKMAIYPYNEENIYDALKNIGYDAFDERLNALQLYQSWHEKKTLLKAMLLDQKFLAGIGNIYADEICFCCGLHPATRVNRLSKKDFENILFQTRRILSGAISAGGTTIRSYTSSLGVSGRFQLELKVHNRVNEACYVCQNTIIKTKIAGRGTYLCPHCQRKK